MRELVLGFAKRYLASFQGLTIECWQGILFALFESTLVAIFYYLSVYFVNDLKLDVGISGVIISCYGIGAIFGGYVGGVSSDRIGPIYVSALSLVIQGISYMLFTGLSSTLFLMINVFMLGFASYVFITSNHMVVLNACQNDGRQKVKALNLLATASNLGSGLAGLLLGYFLYFGFHKVFIAISVLLFILAVSILCSGKVNQSRQCADTGESSSKNDDNESGDKYDVFSVAVVLFSVLFVGSVISQLGSAYPIYIKEVFSTNGIKVLSILFAINSFLVVLIANPVGDYCGRFNKVMMVGVGGLLICLGMFLLAFCANIYMAIIACIVYTFGEVIFFSLAQYVCYHADIPGGQGKKLGFFRSVYAGSRILGPLVGGFLYQRYGGSMVWYVSGVIGLVSVMSCVYAVARAESREPRAESGLVS